VGESDANARWRLAKEAAGLERERDALKAKVERLRKECEQVQLANADVGMLNLEQLGTINDLRVEVERLAGYASLDDVRPPDMTVAAWCQMLLRAWEERNDHCGPCWHRDLARLLGDESKASELDWQMDGVKRLRDARRVALQEAAQIARDTLRGCCNKGPARERCAECSEAFMIAEKIDALDAKGDLAETGGSGGV